MSENQKLKWLNLIDWYEERGFKHPVCQKGVKEKKAETSLVVLHIVCENFFEHMETLESLISKMNLDAGCAFNIYENVDAFIQNVCKSDSQQKIILWWMATKNSVQTNYFKNKYGINFEVSSEHEITLDNSQSLYIFCSFHPEDWQKTPAYKKDVWSQALKIKAWL